MTYGWEAPLDPPVSVLTSNDLRYSSNHTGDVLFCSILNVRVLRFQGPAVLIINWHKYWQSDLDCTSGSNAVKGARCKEFHHCCLDYCELTVWEYRKYLFLLDYVRLKKLNQLFWRYLIFSMLHWQLDCIWVFRKADEVTIIGIKGHQW